MGQSVSIYGTALVSVLALLLIRSRLEGPKLDHIPTHGHAGHLTSFITYYRYLFDCKAFLQEGLDKYGTDMFKIRTPEGWKVICADSSFVEDIRKAHENDISMEAASDIQMASKHTFGIYYEEDESRSLYHVEVVRNQLTKNLAIQFPEVYDEISQSFTDIIPLTQDWVSVPFAATIKTIVSRTSNRYFVGLPLCRNPEWADLNITFTIDVIKTHFMNLFPNFLKPLAGKLVPACQNAMKQGEKWAIPIIKDRLEKESQYGKDWDAPNDLITWLLESASEKMRTPENISRRLLIMNFAAIHTSSMTFTHALYHLVSRPEYIKPLREEIQAVIDEEGWTKAAMGRMRKLDSFIKECVRVESFADLLMMRRILMRDFTFSNGVTLPEGTTITIPLQHRHNQEAIYPSPGQFEGFRFSKLREGEDGDAVKHQFSSTSKDWIIFGHGKHSCPGRFFAANEIKAMMAHLLLNYDVKLAQEGVRPQNFWFMGSNIPNQHAHLLLRKRQM